jgi:hypothetical protein
MSYANFMNHVLLVVQAMKIFDWRNQNHIPEKFHLSRISIFMQPYSACISSKVWVLIDYYSKYISQYFRSKT